ncbi:ABC transporter substrate-binding protein [Rhizobium leguminosarum]|uniref:ABC transporter substrate-binding protein n=1 Tax=Rhizobium leguminosarum TaxID=384 RepID=UPI001C918B30|nr:ABC transporter substrate-binding protein [Rhizobium leguminosarum]MBY2915382.1 ABC transporter substrate-binding protein [Rhizobium leguminosarum]MBY2970920.1 ABC transporter substrate-binding protein [Rhizobium leguminosarum]MBY2977987.1 ABC transporter substrate-binding protein [Rhizobium leguminosarum]MBY3006537.1 ABC transporter substrate-binding protein [Rhizobium leguminosarum]MBY5460885.1 ABC transporter substrate-binding protein [Rhizobium leguminosarum]
MNKLLARTLLAATALALCHPVYAAEKLRIATEGAYPPFNELLPDGSLAGFDVDIAKAICADMKVECEFVKQDWDGLIPGLLAKKFDLIAASMTITDERKKKVDFTAKYYQTPSQFSAKKGSGLDVTPEGLKGKSIGVQRGTIHACYIEKLFGGSDVKLYPSQQEAFADLMAGRVDVAFSDTVGATEQLLKPAGGQNYELVGSAQKDPACLGEGVGIALRKDNGELRDRLSKAIKDIREDGTYEKINTKYFTFDIYGD